MASDSKSLSNRRACRIAARSERGRQTFVVRVAEALHAYGTPAYRLEEVVDQLAHALGLAAQVLATPTAIQVAFDTPSGQRPHMVRVAPSEPNLGKLVALERVVLELQQGRMSLPEANAAVRRIRSAARRYRPWLNVLAVAVASGTAAVFLGGGIWDVTVATILAVLMRPLAGVTAGRPEVAGVFELVSAFMTSLVSWLLAALLPSLSPQTVTLATLIMLVPGLTLTVAVSELASGHLVSGTARMSAALTLFVSLAFGVALGQAVAETMVSPLLFESPDSLPLGLRLAALALAPLAFVVLFDGARQDLPWIWVAGVLGFIGARLGAAWLGPELGTFVGALVLGIASNVYARRLRRPSLVLRVPGLLLLVPGSLGFRSLASFAAQDPLAGVEGLFRVALIAMGLVAGLFSANLFLRVRDLQGPAVQKLRISASRESFTLAP